MFQSVISQSGLSAGRFGAGVWVSLMVHAGVFTGVIALSGRAVVTAVTDPEITMVRHIPQPPKGNPTPTQVARTTPAKPKPPKKELVQPKKIPPPPPETLPQATEPEPAPANPEADVNDLPYIPGSDPNGVTEGGIPGAKVIAGLALGNGLGSTGEEVLPFGSGMTPPEMLSGAQIQYTREAMEAHVSGVIIARCTITREGSVENCRIIKGLPFMDAAVVEALTTRHYRPVHFQGRPVSVSYTFNVKLRMP
ncbi:TonB family protein [Archangium sp.]|jgi:protein TonB|uniref:energy transducer TonB n=1 Tax=Archangium sp. TaxID=1872627 RepID=UPI002ED929F1